MLIFEDVDLRAGIPKVVDQAELDDLKLTFYIVCVVFAGALLILLGCVIGLFAWVQRISISLKKTNETSTLFNTGRSLKPDEELAKRYTMTGHENKSLNRSPQADRNSLSRQASIKKPDVLNTGKLKNNTKGTGLAKKPDKRSEQHTSIDMDGIHFVEDRLRDDLYY